VLELRDVSHTYRGERGRTVTLTRGLDGVSLTVPSLQFVSVIGSSGCGKTTLLRLIAGLIRPSEGEIRVQGEPVRGTSADRAVVFQQHALYPWRTVAANVTLALELSGIAQGAEAQRIAADYLELVSLTEFADHHPSQLSGGMQQRVGVARALAVSPSILLMDEPFGSLDAITRRELGAELLRIWEAQQRTVVFVTHSIDEALTLSDRVVLLREGRVAADFPVDLPRPRDPDGVVEEPEFVELRRELRELI
jgi:NitT/TauT family transport system ATP-binding protein